jgi:hypothetical protein
MFEPENASGGGHRRSEEPGSFILPRGGRRKSDMNAA